MADQDRLITPRLGLIGLDVADVPFGYAERVEFSDVMRANNAILDGLSPNGGTNAPLAWHVEASGSDATGDGSVSLPFRTPTGALAKLSGTFGPRIRHLVDILIGSGSYPGWLVQGWEMDPATNQNPVGIRFIGTMVPPVLASGATSGTFTSVTPGNIIADVVYARVADSTQTWVPGALHGMFCRINTGTSALQILPIFNNTATELVLPSNGTLGSIGGTYDIVVPGTYVQTSVPIAPSLVAANAANQNPTPIQVGIGVFNVEVAPSTTEIRFENIDVAPTSSIFGVTIQGEACTFSRCRIRPLTNLGITVNGGVGTINVSQCVINVAGSGQTCLSVAGTGLQTYTQNLYYGNSGQSATSVNISGQAIVQVTTSMLEPASFGIPITGQCVLTLNGTTITGGGSGVSQLIRSRVIEGGAGAVFISANALSLRDNPASAGLEIQGPAFANITALFATGSLYPVLLSNGGRVRIGPTSIISGTLPGQEIILDSFSVPATLALLRAQSPKLLSTSQGSAIWEDP